MGKTHQTTRRDRRPIRERKIFRHFALPTNYVNKRLQSETAKHTDTIPVYPQRFSDETIHFSEFSNGRFTPAFFADRSIDFFAHRLHIFRTGSKII